uniref:Uncharacterized protein n=1 Tax=mine drainage metagenome TaxID=410659 RepID=E6PVD8_9ZZZZ
MHTSTANSNWMGTALPTSQSIVSYRGLLRSHPGQAIEQQVRRGGEHARVCSLVSCRDANHDQAGQSASTELAFPIARAMGCVSTDSRGLRCGALVRVFGLWRKVNSHGLKSAPDAIANTASAHQTSVLPDIVTNPSATQTRALIRYGRRGEATPRVRVRAPMPTDLAAEAHEWRRQRFCPGRRRRSHVAPVFARAQSAKQGLMYYSVFLNSVWHIPRSRPPPKQRVDEISRLACIERRSPREAATSNHNNF